MKTLLLDTVLWDFVLDAAGNWAVADVPYALSQDVASSIRTFILQDGTGEVWYDDTLGIPYFANILGKTPPIPVFQEFMVNAAFAATPLDADVRVVRAQCVIQSFSAETREVTGQVQFIDSNGNIGSVSL